VINFQKVKCRRCSGRGVVPHRTAQHDSRCFCCGGKGFYYRKPATRRLTEADRIAEINAKIAEWRA
jgi:DnaJ-class molecular chaperone